MISSLWDSNNYGIGYHIMSGPSGMQSVVFRNVNTKPLYIRVTTVADFDDSQNAPIVTEADDLITIDLKPVKGNMIAYWTLYLQSVNNSNWKLVLEEQCQVLIILDQWMALLKMEYGHLKI